MTELEKQRLINGARYFKDLKPSDMIVAGTIKPTTWNALMKYCDLVLLVLNDQMTLDRLEEIISQ